MSTVIERIEEILTSEYDVARYVELMSEVFDGIQLQSVNYSRKEYSNFSSHIESYTHIGTYTTPDKKKILILAVELKNQSYVENSRSTQRSYAKRLIENGNADAAIVAFYTAGDSQWRLSFVRLDYEMKFENDKLKTAENMTPAKRYSFLVGKDEPCHTAVERFRLFLENYTLHPTLDDLENAFSVETVTKEFFNLYCEKFHQLREHLEKNEDFVREAELHNFSSAQFAKKLMGQIVFLYFLQKKGWLGVKAWPARLSSADYKKAFFARGAKSRELIPQVYKQISENEYAVSVQALNALSNEDETVLSTCVKGEPWGSGPRNFMRRLFETAQRKNANFFDDYLEPLFYDALNVNRGEQGYDPALHCRIPFLSGGLFEPIDGYDWKHNNFDIPNEIFSNKKDEHDRLADGILDIFDRYNFTMSEDEPMEREVAIDPEMLGKVFENLLDVTDRKSKGAFYTPREIVHYMCQESLINYLTNTLHVSETAIRDFILYGDFMKDEDASVLNRAEAGDSYTLFISEELYELDTNGTIKTDRMAELDKALSDVRVADPAVGSGAFPLGMLNEIVRARQNITTYMDITQKIVDPKGAGREIRYRRVNERSARQLKYDTIRNCIFAVDIEPSAVDIAQLRLWLALVIDDEIDPNAMTALDGHRNPLPLPNLECNIRCGNSLIDEFEEIKLINESDLLGNVSNISQTNFYQSGFDATLERLIAKQDELFRCDSTEKKSDLLQEIEDLRNAVIMTQLDGASPETIEKYEETKHMASKPFMLWQLDFAKVFREKGGFDIVIGNPPYIQLQKAITDDGSVKLGDLYKNQHFETFEKTGDIYCLFYEKGYLLLHDDGILTFITSNKWMRAGYGKSLRGFFASKTNPIKLIDFANQKIFESATVDVNILVFERCINQGKTLACTAGEECRNNLSVYVERNGVLVVYKRDESWTILNSLEQSIKRKVETIGIPLKKWNIQINYGVKTGCNEAFIVDEVTKDRLIREDPSSAQIIRPILRGRDIKRYGYNYANLWLINTHNGIKEKGVAPVDISNFPAIKAHLDQFWSKLEKRADKGDTPYNLRNCAYMDDFSKQKIVYREISDAMDACLIEDEVYVNNKCYLITGEALKYLICFLNSKLFNKIVIQGANVTGGKGHDFLEKIRLPKIGSPNVFDELYDSIVQKSTKEIDHLIDLEIYKIFGLSESEIDYLEHSP